MIDTSKLEHLMEEQRRTAAIRDQAFARMNAVAIEIRDRLGVSVIADVPNANGNARSYHFASDLSFATSAVSAGELEDHHSGDYKTLRSAEEEWEASCHAAHDATRKLCDFLAELTGMRWLE